MNDPTQKLERPRTRSDCRNGLRPCPWVGCKYHLFWLQSVESRGKRGVSQRQSKEQRDARRRGLTYEEPFDEYLAKRIPPWLMQETCLLDVSERGGATLEDVGAIMRLTRERVRQIEVKAMRKLRTWIRKNGRHEMFSELLQGVEESGGSGWLGMLLNAGIVVEVETVEETEEKER